MSSGVSIHLTSSTLSQHPSFASISINESLDDDCQIHPEARAVFLERIFHVFNLRHDDVEIRILKKELKELLCHNTDLKGKMICTIYYCHLFHD